MRANTAGHFCCFCARVCILWIVLHSCHRCDLLHYKEMKAVRSANVEFFSKSFECYCTGVVSEMSSRELQIAITAVTSEAKQASINVEQWKLLTARIGYLLSSNAAASTSVMNAATSDIRSLIVILTTELGVYKNEHEWATRVAQRGCDAA